MATQIRAELAKLIVTSYLFGDVASAPRDGETLVEEDIFGSIGILELAEFPGPGSMWPKPRRCRRTRAGPLVSVLRAGWPGGVHVPSGLRVGVTVPALAWGRRRAAWQPGW